MNRHVWRALAGAAAFLCLTPAIAADNFAPVSSGSVIYRSKDIGTNGVPLQVPFQIPSDITGTPLLTLANPGVVTLSAPLVLGSGSAAIGTVGVTSLPPLTAGTAAIGTVGVTALPSLPAGANAIGSVTVSNFPGTQVISASSLPLPTGAATATNQTTANTSLAAIQTALTIGQVPIASGVAAAGKTPVAFVLSTTSATPTTGISAIFTPKNGQAFALRGDATGGSVQVTSKSPNDTVWRPITAAGTQLYKFSGPFNEAMSSEIVGEQFRVEVLAVPTVNSNTCTGLFDQP